MTSNNSMGHPVKRNLQMKDKDRELLDYIVEFTTDHLYPPTIREMKTAINVSSTSTVFARLERLEFMDEIRRDDSGRITLTGYHLEKDAETAMNRA